MRNLVRKLGRGLRYSLIAIGALVVSGGIIAIADYQLTQGSGTSFASVVVSSKHYIALLICDATAGEAQCSAVNSSGQVAVQLPPGAATSALQTTINTTLGSPMQNSGGSVTANLGTLNGAATAANQATANTTLSTIATNTGAAIPAGTNAIGTLLPIAETTASSGVLKAFPGNLFTVSVDAVATPVDFKLMLFNSTTLPADGAVTPYKCISFKGDGTQASFLLSWSPDALSFSTGISAAVSSSTACTTKTNVTATISGQVQ